jgi:Fe-S-cluster formation regulator IscX/YfhJ
LPQEEESVNPKTVIFTELRSNSMR